jgi:ribose transport system permease protein
MTMSAIPSSDARLQRNRMTPVVFFARYGFYVALLILVFVFTALSPNFLTIPNGVNILQQTSTIGVMALGETLVILGGGVDVSVGSVLGLGGMVAAMVMRMPHASPLFAVAAGMFAGLLIGLLNGAIITGLGIDAFITTLATLNVGRGLVYILSNQYNVDVPDGSPFFALGRGYIGGLPNSVVIFLILFVVLYVVERRTVFGRSIHAIGGNLRASYLSSLPIARIRLATYAISGACAALAGVIVVSQTGIAVPYLGTGYELDTIAAAVVGGVALTGGAGSVLVGALGSIFIGVLLNGMALINVPAIWQMVIQGLVIIAAVALYAAARSRTQ